MAVIDYIPLNFDLLKSPINWLIVTLMVVMAGLMLSLIFHAPGTNAE